MVERRLGKGQGENVGDQERDGAGPEGFRRAPRLLERPRRQVDCGEARLGTVAEQRDGLRADAAARLEDGGPRRIARVAVQEVGQGLRLIAQALRLRLLVAVNVVGRHVRSSTRTRMTEPGWLVLNEIAASRRAVRRRRLRSETARA